MDEGGGEVKRRRRPRRRRRQSRAQDYKDTTENDEKSESYLRIVASDGTHIDVEPIGDHVGLHMVWDQQERALVVSKVPRRQERMMGSENKEPDDGSDDTMGYLNPGSVLVAIGNQSVQGFSHSATLRALSSVTHSDLPQTPLLRFVKLDTKLQDKYTELSSPYQPDTLPEMQASELTCLVDNPASQTNTLHNRTLQTEANSALSANQQHSKTEKPEEEVSQKSLSQMDHESIFGQEKINEIDDSLNSDLFEDKSDGNQNLVGERTNHEDENISDNNDTSNVGDHTDADSCDDNMCEDDNSDEAVDIELSDEDHNSYRVDEDKTSLSQISSKPKLVKRLSSRAKLRSKGGSKRSMKLSSSQEEDLTPSQLLERAIEQELLDIIKTQTISVWWPGQGLSWFPPATHATVAVRNLSIRAATRFYMGARRAAWNSIEKSKMSSAFEVRIMKLDHAPPGSEKRLGWTKSFVGTFKSQKLAEQAVQSAMRRRDLGLVGIPPRPHPELCATMESVLNSNLLVTHLDISVESNNLEGSDFLRKYAYIWNILRYHCTSLLPFQIHEPISQMAKVSYMGQHVRQLPLLTSLPVSVSICARDGLPRTASGPQQLPEQMRKRVGRDQSKVEKQKKPATIKEMRKLVEESDEEEDRDARNEDRKLPRKRFRHFFKGLSSEAKELARKTAFQAEQKAVRDRRKGTPQNPGYDADSNNRRGALRYNPAGNQNEPIQVSMWSHRQKMKAVAITLQRIYRAKHHPKILRAAFRAEHHILTLQRFIRGWIGRRRAEEWRILANYSAEHIQRFWYMIRAQRRVKFIKTERERLCLLLQPIVRGMIARKILAWRKRDDWAATKIQSVIRGHRDRGLFKRLIARDFHFRKVVPAAITIQRVARGMRDRKIARLLRYERHYADVVVPSSIVLQNMWRQRMAKRKLQELKARQLASTMLQRIIRGRLERRKFTRLVAWKAQQDAATRISSVVRGWMAREIYTWRLKEHHREFVQQPAARKIQAVWHGLQTRRWFRVLVKKDAAVIVLQRAWRTVLARRKARETLDSVAQAYLAKLATRLQSAFRGFRGRRRFRHLWQERDAQRLWATTFLQRQWRAYTHKQAKKRRRAEVARELHYLDLELLLIDIDEIEQDIQEAEEERNRILQYVRKSEKHRRALKVSRREMEYRLPELELELDKLDPEEEADIPWVEAFESEIEQISNILAMSEQELESKKLQLATLENDIAELKMEIEDLQIDMDDVVQQRASLIDEHRVRELRACTEEYQKDRERRIRHQRLKWKPRDVRRKVLTRVRMEAMPPLPPSVINASRMMLDRVSTISVKKRNQYRSSDQNAVEKIVLQQRLEKMHSILDAGTPTDLVRKSFDGAIERTKHVVQDFTYDLRRSKNDIRGDPRKVCQECGLVIMACQCNL